MVLEDSPEQTHPGGPQLKRSLWSQILKINRFKNKIKLKKTATTAVKSAGTLQTEPGRCCWFLVLKAAGGYGTFTHVTRFCLLGAAPQVTFTVGGGPRVGGVVQQAPPTSSRARGINMANL